MRAADLGAAYGTAKSGVGVSSMGVMKPDLIMKSIIPVVMAGVLGIYGLIIAVIIANGVMPPTSEGTTKYSSFTGFAHLAAGLACGLSGLAAGIAIGIVGDAGVRANAQQAKLYVGMVLILIFAEARAHPRSARCARLRSPIASRRSARACARADDARPRIRP